MEGEKLQVIVRYLSLKDHFNELVDSITTLDKVMSLKGGGKKIGRVNEARETLEATLKTRRGLIVESCGAWSLK